MGRPKEHDAATGQALLDAAEKQLAAGGPDAVSVRGVAMEVGTTTRAVYTVFGGKEGLLAALAVRGFLDLGRRVDAVAETADPAADLIRTGVAAFRPFALDTPHLFRLTFERLPASLTENQAVLDAAQQSAQGLVGRIKRCKQAGLIERLTTREALFAFHATCQGLASCELAHQPAPVGANFWPIMQGANMETIWSEAIASLVRGFSG